MWGYELSTIGKLFFSGMFAKAVESYLEQETLDQEVLSERMETSAVFRELCVKYDRDSDRVREELLRRGWALNKRDFERVLKVKWPF